MMSLQDTITQVESSIILAKRGDSRIAVMSVDNAELFLSMLNDRIPVEPLVFSDWPDRYGYRKQLHICGACKKGSVENAKFCPECGKPVKQNESL